MKLKSNLLLCISLLLILSCKSQNDLEKKKLVNNIELNKIDSIKSILKLTDNQMVSLVKNDTVINELSLIIKDSSKIQNTKKRLDMFFTGKYDSKKLWVSLQLERILESGSFKLSDSIDPKNAIHFKNAKEVKIFMKKIDSVLKQKVTVKVKDSTKKKKH
jgi:hypothetical protein